MTRETKQPRKVDEQLFASIVRSFETATDKEGKRLNMDSIIISQGEQIYTHYFKTTDEMNDIRSVSKPILGIALGIAMERELTIRNKILTLDTLVWPFFESKVQITNQRNIPKLGRVKLRHLLNHTIGHEVGLMFSKDIRDRDPETLLDYIWNTEIVYEPGEHFFYSNAGPFLISAIVQEELGVNLSAWINDLVFRPLGIENFEWKNYGKYCAASSGLRISNRDLHKIGRVFVENGRYAGGQLVPQRWLNLMRSPQVATPTYLYDETRVFPKYAYGYYLWICRDGSYYCDGTDGQYLIVLPRIDVVITTFGHQSDMKPITECLRPLLPTHHA
jgi:CubicO group peptidase (beta-lactamase class C family)